MLTKTCCGFAAGTTYEEARAVDTINRTSNYGLRVVLGGTHILNSEQFLEHLKRSSDMLAHAENSRNNLR